MKSQARKLGDRLIASQSVLKPREQQAGGMVPGGNGGPRRALWLACRQDGRGLTCILGTGLLLFSWMISCAPPFFLLRKVAMDHPFVKINHPYGMLVEKIHKKMENSEQNDAVSSDAAATESE